MAIADDIADLPELPVPMLPAKLVPADSLKGVLASLNAQIGLGGGSGAGGGIGVDITLAPWNAPTDGTGDCAPILQAIVDAGYRTVWFPGGTMASPKVYRFESQVNLPAGTKLVGENHQTVLIDALSDLWVEGLRNTDTNYTTDWSRIEISGFTVKMAYGGITIHGHESRVFNMRFRGGLPNRWCIQLHASNEFYLGQISAGYGGGIHNLVANGIRIYAEDTPTNGERTVNFGDGLIEDVSLKGAAVSWMGIVIEHLSTDTSLGVMNNIKCVRVQAQAPVSSSHPDAVPAGSVYAYNASTGLKLHRVQRSFFDTVDLEGNDIGCYAAGDMIGLQTGATRRNTFVNCQAFNCRSPWVDTNSSLDGSVGQNGFVGGQEFGPLTPVGLQNGDPNAAFTGKRATYDWMVPGALFFARPGNGDFKAALRVTDNEHFYFVNLYQESPGVTPFDTMPKYLTPRKALGVDVSSALNAARIFRPQGYATGKESRIVIGNGEGFTLPSGGDTLAVGPLHRVEIADPLYLSPWTAQPSALGSNVPGILINAQDKAAIGAPSSGYWWGPGLYGLIDDANQAQRIAEPRTFVPTWVPATPRPGMTAAQMGRTATSYTVDRTWFGKLSEHTNSSLCTITIPADLIRAEEDGGGTHKTAATFRVARSGSAEVEFAAGSGVTIRSTLGSGATISPTASQYAVFELTYIRTGAGTATVYLCKISA